ncbi:2'-5' RNA ligase family protein [Streptomyces sp. NPDC048383]|uniref:2'-5' RNA ligase family protein n=1 Tax=Streptomyces sp. NPDC048383 TaxID=3155386 RepID=UPI003417BB67
MADDSGALFEAGQTGLIILTPEAEPTLQGWRERLDPSARVGVPAHVTVLFPFLDASRLDAGVDAALADLVGRHQPFDLRFASSGRFPDVLYLVPEPDAPLRGLTRSIVERWPEAPPYGGRFVDIVPHLTVVHGQEDPVLDAIEVDLADTLPFTCHVSSVELMVYDGSRWRERSSYALGG